MIHTKLSEKTLFTALQMPLSNILMKFSPVINQYNNYTVLHRGLFELVSVLPRFGKLKRDMNFQYNLNGSWVRWTTLSVFCEHGKGGENLIFCRFLCKGNKHSWELRTFSTSQTNSLHSHSQFVSSVSFTRVKTALHYARPLKSVATFQPNTLVLTVQKFSFLLFISFDFSFFFRL